MRGYYKRFMAKPSDDDEQAEEEVDWWKSAEQDPAVQEIRAWRTHPQ
jgi:hypothetical protein